MIFGVKKGNFCIYAICSVVGIIFVIFSFILNKFDCFKEIFIGLGCGFIPSSLTAFFLDRINIKSNIKAENDKRKQMREIFLRSLSYGVCWIAKTIIEEFYAENEKNDSFINVFNKVVEEEEKNKNEIKDIAETYNKINVILRQLNYGISLCEKDGIAILRNKLGFVESNIFTNDELAYIQCIIDNCKEIPNKCFMPLLIDKVQELINNACGISEIKNIFERPVLIKKSKVRNWVEIVK